MVVVVPTTIMQVVVPVPAWVTNQIKLTIGPVYPSSIAPDVGPVRVSSNFFSWIVWQENYEILTGLLQDGGQFQAVEVNLKFQCWSRRQ